jgi:peptidoglycan/LPS O-acetylase OafA/YrhL
VQLPHLPGLDGLRAFAVIAVLLYHAELSWIPGGFLGVEIFFVISGYLITTLLLAEWRQQGRIDLKAFWLRRARRLLPALYLLLVVTLAFSLLFLPGEVARLRSDAIAAFGYVTNWYLVFGHQSYFETAARPSLLQHLWSLAIEEQFYILWPLLLAAGMSWGVIRWRRKRLLLGAIAGAAASTLLMAILYRPDVDPSRVYYGTDTRAAGLLVGVALAFVWAPGRFFTREAIHRCLQRQTRWVDPLLLDILGLGALGGLIWFCLRLNESQPFLFRGGFATVALTTAVVIMALVHPHTYLGSSLLEWWPLRWVGLRSYGIYLWHWPVFTVTRPQLDLPVDGLPLLVLRLTATVVLAALSYRYIETPIRRGALGRAWRALREAQGARRWRLGAGWVGAVGSAMTLCVALGIAVALAQPPAPPSYLSAESVHTEGSAAAPDTDNPTTTVDTGTSAPAADTTESTSGATSAVASTDAPTPTGPVTAIGDSVMVGAAGELEQNIGNVAIDAEVGRQAAAVIDILRQRRASGQLGDVVIIHIGNNGTVTDEQFDEMMQELKDVRKVIVVNVKVPRSWEQVNNGVIAAGVQRYPKAILIDWHAASVDRPELFAEDGYHLQPEGQRVYADLIAAGLKRT